MTCTATASSILLNGSNNTLIVTDISGNVNTSVVLPILNASSTSRGSGLSVKRDICDGNDTSGSLYDGKCSKEVIKSPISSETIPSESIEVPEEN